MSVPDMEADEECLEAGPPTSLCQVPEKLNIKVRVNKGQLADHDLWHSDQATVDLTLRVAGLDYKN
jgi:hypothetical protein